MATLRVTMVKLYWTALPFGGCGGLPLVHAIDADTNQEPWKGGIILAQVKSRPVQENRKRWRSCQRTGGREPWEQIYHALNSTLPKACAQRSGAHRSKQFPFLANFKAAQPS